MRTCSSSRSAVETPPATPGPSQNRAIYGFVLFLVAITGAVIYLLWAFIPPKYLKEIGIDFLPSRYWAVATPICIVSCVLSVPILYGLICLRLLPEGGLESVTQDEYSRPEAYEKVLRNPPDCIPPLCDIPLEALLSSGDHPLVSELAEKRLKLKLSEPKTHSKKKLC